MYGERFEIVSDPFNDGDCIAVHAISGDDPKIRTLRLPIAILVGGADRFLKRANLAGQESLQLGELILAGSAFAQKRLGKKILINGPTTTEAIVQINGLLVS